MACANPFLALKARSESLSETLYLRASWKDPWLGLVPRDVYPVASGYVRTSFTIGRSEPITDEESWATIAAINSNEGPCAQTYTSATVGHKSVNYKPASFDLVGPTICAEELTLAWRSADFWEKYMSSLEKRAKRSISNRLANVYMNYSHRASANASFAFTAGPVATQAGTPSTSAVITTDLDGANIPTSELTQEMLDYTAIDLIEAGATDPNTNGWITLGPDGPVFPLLIGLDMSSRLALNNSEFRNDLNQSYNGLKDANPVLQRLGASRVIKNFRHVVTPFPARWKLDSNLLVRVPTWTMTAGEAGEVAVLNPDWKDASIAAYEAAVVLSPWVMTEEVLQPINSIPGATFNPMSYMGEWDFVTGNDAFLGIDSCTGKADPQHRQGRHFAHYRNALKPVFPEFGRFILFKRCPTSSFDTIACS